MIRTILLTLLLAIVPPAVFACEVCKDQQPKVLRGITHGTGPEGLLDYALMTLAMLVVVVTLYFSIKYLVSPKEEDHTHIKTLIIHDNQ